MLQVYLMIGSIILFDAIILFCRHVFNRPVPFDNEVNAEVTLNSNNLGYLLLPFLFFVFPYAWLTILTQENPHFVLVPFFVCSLLTAIGVMLLIKFGYKRYYLATDGITVLNLAKMSYVHYPLASIKGYRYKSGYRIPDSYDVILANKRIGFEVSSIKDVNSFREYFERHDIPYYEYDWLTGNDYRK